MCVSVCLACKNTLIRILRRTKASILREITGSSSSRTVIDISEQVCGVRV
jgi:hypothetical protein